jgi:predicted transposase/invertase (TIGR01784 family)
MLATKSPEMRETVMVLKELSADERARLIFEAREKARRDEAARIYGATNKGMEKGRTEGKAEVAKNLLALGVDVEVISKSSGLSVEEIKSFSGA